MPLPKSFVFPALSFEQDLSAARYDQLNNFYFRLPNGFYRTMEPAGTEVLRAKGLDPFTTIHRRIYEVLGQRIDNKSEIWLDQSRNQFFAQIDAVLKMHTENFEVYCSKLERWYDSEITSTEERKSLIKEIFPIAFATYIDLRKMGYGFDELIS